MLDKQIAGATIAFYLVAIIQAGSIAGRVGVSMIADKLGPVNLLIAAILGNGILAFCWIAIDNEAGLIVFAILYGACLGVALGMAPAALMNFMKGDLRRYGTFSGMGFLLAAPGVLVGNPISGAILRGSGGFVGLQAFCGSILLLATVIFFAARGVAVGWGPHKM